MNKLFLNLGCGDKLIPGFINIDIIPSADLQIDVTEGLPYDDNSVNGIYSEHFYEHLSQAEGARLFRECRRILKPGRRLRIATPDLDFEIDRYLQGDWEKYNDLPNFGIDWVQNRCELFNMAMRDWGHKWLYNEEELVRLGKYSGLVFEGRFEYGKSPEPKFVNLEYRKGSRLILEFSKRQRRNTGKHPLVSVLIPAYNSEYFQFALESAVNQTYNNIEIIVCNEEGDDRIQKVVKSMQKKNNNLHYHENPVRLGSKGNYIKCFNLAKGEYIKFLSDDDILHEECIRLQVKYLQDFPHVTLVTSYRKLIDNNGNILEDEVFNELLFKQSKLINGDVIVSLMLKRRMNFIGEPTTTLFRKDDLIETYPDIFSFAGRSALANGDVAMWSNLLSKGALIYISQPLSYFRIHSKQEQKSEDFLKIAQKGFDQLFFDSQRMGFTYNEKREIEAINKKIDIGSVLTIKKNCEKLVSIIIPVFNNFEFTKKCIDSIEKNTDSINYEIIIVDNGSTDGTRDYLSQMQSKLENLTSICNDRNRGFARANNQAVKISKGEYLLFLNNDTEVQTGWLDNLVNLTEDHSIGAIGSKLLYPDNTIQHAGIVIANNISVGDPLQAQNIFVGKPSDFYDANHIREFQAVTAACMLISKNSFESVGGFDERFWNGYEDIDLCFKLREKGYKIIYQPESVVIHHESKSGKERFLKVSDNIRLLHDKWLGKIAVDFVIDADGRSKQTDNGLIKLYKNDESHFPRKNNNAVAVSIIILTFNALKYTKKCIQSIQEHTQYPYEIIFVDNHSTDGTKKYLSKLVRKHPNYELIKNKGNKGFAAGNNQGVDAANGDYILLLNNDVLVADGWLESLVMALEKDEKIGMVGPITNYISGRQLIKNVQYKDNKEFLEFAQQVRMKNDERITPRRRIAGFAVLMKKSLYLDVGGLDESFGTGNYEDDDLCLKVREKGYAIMVDESTFIHHYGNQTFKANKIDYNQSLKGKGTKFKKKWPKVDYEELLELKHPLCDLHPSLLEKASGHFIQGDFDKAFIVFKQVYVENPLSQDALFGMAVCVFNRNDHKTATKYFHRLLELNPDHASAYNQLGIIAAESGDLNEANTLFIKAIGIDTTFIDAQRNLGEILLEQGDYDNGVKTFAKILENHPDDIPTLLRMAELHAEVGNDDEAKNYAETVLECEPENENAQLFVNLCTN